MSDSRFKKKLFGSFPRVTVQTKLLKHRCLRFMPAPTANSTEILRRVGGQTCSEENLNRTPDVFRPGFRGRTPRYSPSEFGLSENEQFQHPRIFRDLDYNTDQATFEALRNAQPRPLRLCRTRPVYENLPEERVDDISAPSFNVTMPSDAPNISRGSRRQLPNECLNDVPSPSIYKSFVSLPHTTYQFTNECLDNVSEPSFADTPGSRKKCIDYRTTPSLVDMSNTQGTKSPGIFGGNQGLLPGKGAETFLNTPRKELNCVKETIFHQPGMESKVKKKKKRRKDTIKDTANGTWNLHLAILESVMKQISDTKPEDTTAPTMYDLASLLAGEICDTSENVQNKQQSQRKSRDENIDDITMPSFDESSIPPLTSTKKQINMSCEHLSASSIGIDISRPLPHTRNQSIRRQQNNDMSSRSTQGHASQPREWIDDISAPSFGRDVSMQSPLKRNRSFPREQISNISEPYYQSTMKSTLPSECLDEVTMPSFKEHSSRSTRGHSSQPREWIDDISAPSFGRDVSIQSPLKRNRSFPREQISNISEPYYQSTMKSTLPSECLHEVTMPSFKEHSSRSTQGQASQPREWIDNISAPSFGRDISMQSPLRRNRSLPREQINNISEPYYQSTLKSTLPSECLEDVTMPSFKEHSSQSARGQPREWIDDISAPSFGRDVSMQSPLKRNRSFPREQISNISEPYYQSTMKSTLPSECLDEVTMPSFKEHSSRSTRGHASQPREWIDDISAPSFGKDVSMQSPPKRDRSFPREQISKISEPYYQSTMKSTLPSECLDEVTMPSFKEHSSRSTRGHASQPREWIDDISAPSFGKDVSMQSPLKRNRSFPREQISNISEPYYQSTMKSTLPSECLDEVTMPSFKEHSSRSTRGHASQPREWIDDISAPSFGRDVSMQSPLKRNRSFPREQISNISEPYYQSTMKSTLPSECLEDVTMPSFKEHSSRSARGQPREWIDDISAPSFGRDVSMQSPLKRNRSFPREQISNISEPNYQSTMKSTLPSECLDEVTMPSFKEHSSRSTQGQASQPREWIDDISAPSFGRDVSMQSPLKRNRSFPREQISNISEPYYQSTMKSTLPSECLDEVTMPSFKEHSSRSTQGQASQPREWIDDISAPSFGRDVSMQSPLKRNRSFPREQISNISEPYYQSTMKSTLPSECLDEVTMPSFKEHSSRSTRGHASQPREWIDDISAPSFGKDVSMQSSLKRNRSFPREQISNISEPYYQSTMKSTLPSECLDEVTMPSFKEHSSRSTQGQASQPREWIDDISAPSFGRDVSMQSPLKRNRSFPREQISNISEPYYQSTMKSTLPSECLDEVTMPSFKEHTSRSTQGQASQPREWIDDISAPSFGRDVSMQSPLKRNRSFPREQISNISEPYYQSTMKSTLPSECLDEVTMPSFKEHSSRSTRGHASQPREWIDDISAPSFGKDVSMQSPLKRNRSFPREQISNISEPYYQSTMKSTLPSECLDEVTMPSFKEHSSRSTRGHASQPREWIDDISAPSFGKDVSMQSSLKRNRSFPREQISNISEPYYQSTMKSTLPSECLDEVTMPSFKENSLRSTRGQASQPREWIDDISAPSFGRDASMQSPLKRNRSFPREQISNISEPYYQSTMKSTLPSECLDEVTMPSFKEHSSRSTRGHASQPREWIDDISAPSFGRDASMQSPLKSNRSFPREQISNISEPYYQSTMKSSLPSECLDEVTMPSFKDRSYRSGREQTLQSREVRDNIRDVSNQPPHRRCHSLPREQISNISPPNFESQISDPRSAQQSTFHQDGSRLGKRSKSLPSQNTKVCINTTVASRCYSLSNDQEEMMMPSFGNTPPASSTKRNLNMPSEILDNYSGCVERHMPNEQSLPSEYLQDISEPPFADSSRSRYSDSECFEVTADSLANDRNMDNSVPIKTAQKKERMNGKAEPSNNVSSTHSLGETIEIRASLMASTSTYSNRQSNDDKKAAKTSQNDQSTKLHKGPGADRYIGFETLANYAPFEDQIRSPPLCRSLEKNPRSSFSTDSANGESQNQ